jgi:hypothetical protein
MIALVIVTVFCWLNWWVLPNIAFVCLEDKGKPLPDSGLVMFGYVQSKVVGHRIIASIDTGWDAFETGWPCFLMGGLVGLGVGYVTGELARRAFAIDTASAEAVRTARELETSGTRKLEYCYEQEGKIAEARRQLAEKTAALAIQRADFNQEKDRFDKKVHNTESNELIKAKTAIQKLEKKITQLQGKPVDD